MDRVKAVIFLVVGAGLLLTALAIGAGVRSFIVESDRAHGRVTRLAAGGSHPEIEFTTASGQAISFSDSGFISGYRSGDEVAVRYRPSEPKLSAKLDTFGALWFAPLMLGLIGAGLLTLGAFNYHIASRS